MLERRGEQAFEERRGRLGLVVARDRLDQDVPRVATCERHPRAGDVRDHEVEHHYFYLDPCNLHPGQEKIVASRIGEELDKARASNEIIATPIENRSKHRFDGALRWPD